MWPARVRTPSRYLQGRGLQGVVTEALFSEISKQLFRASRLFVCYNERGVKHPHNLFNIEYFFSGNVSFGRLGGQL